MLWTHLNCPGWRPCRPNWPISAPVSRTSVLTCPFAPSAVKMKRWSLSSESKRSQVEPFASVVGLDLELLREGAVFAEHLDPVVRAIAHIDEAVVRHPHAMHRIGKLFRGLRRRRIRRLLVVVRRIVVDA